MIFRQKTSYYTLYIYVCVHARGNPHLTAHDIIREAGRKRVVFHAVHCNPPRSALQPVLQCTASRPAVQCIRRAYLVQFQTHVRATAPARSCVRQGKYMRPSSITFATEDANVINRSRKRLRENLCGEMLMSMLPAPPQDISENRHQFRMPPHACQIRGKLLTEK